MRKTSLWESTARFSHILPFRNLFYIHFLQAYIFSNEGRADSLRLHFWYLLQLGLHSLLLSSSAGSDQHKRVRPDFSQTQCALSNFCPGPRERNTALTCACGRRGRTSPSEQELLSLFHLFLKTRPSLTGLVSIAFLLSGTSWYL